MVKKTGEALMSVYEMERRKQLQPQTGQRDLAPSARPHEQWSIPSQNAPRSHSTSPRLAAVAEQFSDSSALCRQSRKKDAPRRLTKIRRGWGRIPSEVKSRHEFIGVRG
jgi:hypothetical protein